MPTPYTQPGVSISGTRITVDAYLRNSPVIQRDLENLTYQRFISDYIFRPGQRTESGSVLYQQLLENELFTARDVKEIEELAAFPIVNTPDVTQLTATVQKWGAAALFSYEKIRRDQRDLLQRDLIRISNTMVRKANRVAMATLNADANVQTFTTLTGAWSTTGSEKIKDLAIARSMIDNADLGYVADTVLVNPTNALELLIDDKVTNRLSREVNNPLLSGQLSGVLNLDYIESNDVAEGTMYVLSRQMVGSVHDELPLYSRVLDQPENESRLLQVARVMIPVITDPRACVKITGI